MQKVKVMVIVGTRPELIKLSRTILELNEYANLVFVHTGQNYDYELNEIFFEDLALPEPDYFLDVAGGSLAETIAEVIVKADEVMEQERPDALLLLGDTNSCLSAIPAKRRKIPIFHMEAGNRCFDARVPEETNRKIVDHISDINMPYTEHARRYLLAEGLRPDMVIKTGSPMPEVLAGIRQKLQSSDVLDQLELSPGQYFVVSAHREENVDTPENLRNILESLNAIAAEYDLPIIVSTHPRTRKRLDELTDAPEISEQVRFVKPLGFVDYVALQTQAACVISDSGTITEESSILDFPAITIRQSHERPEGMDEGVLIMSGFQSGRVLQALNVILGQGRESARRCVCDYTAENVSHKVVRIILSYIDFVRREVWKELS